MGRPNPENLIPMNRRTKEEQRKIATAGGVASGKSRKFQADLQKMVRRLLKVPLEDAELEKVGCFKDFGKKNVILIEAIFQKGLYKSLVNGDIDTLLKILKAAGLTEESLNLQVGGSLQTDNPYANLSEEQLLQLINQNDE